jgi:hypothetical protein
MDKPIPKPGELENQSGKWVQRVPKSIHLRLVNRAREEGVSLNTLVITMLSESLAYAQSTHGKLVEYHSAHTKVGLTKKERLR